MLSSITYRALAGSFAWFFTSTPIRPGSSDFAEEAISAIRELQKSYDSANGLYDNLWWNSANVITMLADFQECFPSLVTNITSTVFPTTLTIAPPSNGAPNFLNDYYDDELWWALAWIKVYDITSDVGYLNTAYSIFEDAKAAWGIPQCGGLQWNKQHDPVNAIENSLYLTTAAKLANRTPTTSTRNYYLDEAIKAYTFIISSGLINSQNLLNDGLLPKSPDANTSCKNNNGITWSYNQGALLSGLAEMTSLTNDSKYLDLAITITSAAIDHLTDSNGILHDLECENRSPPCAGDSGQFKGVFVRNVQFLIDRADLPTRTAALLKEFIEENARSIWDNAQSGSRLGPIWSGPYSEASVQEQSSALDVIVAAACIS